MQKVTDEVQPTEHAPLQIFTPAHEDVCVSLPLGLIRMPIPVARQTQFSPRFRALLHQLIEIHATVVIRHVDLTAINHGRIKLVEQELNPPAFRVP